MKGWCPSPKIFSEYSFFAGIQRSIQSVLSNTSKQQLTTSGWGAAWAGAAVERQRGTPLEDVEDASSSTPGIRSGASTACRPCGALGKMTTQTCSAKWKTASEAGVSAVAVLMTGDPWPACSDAAANPRQATCAPCSGQLDGVPRMKARTRALASKPAATPWSPGGGESLSSEAAAGGGRSVS